MHIRLIIILHFICKVTYTMKLKVFHKLGYYRINKIQFSVYIRISKR